MSIDQDLLFARRAQECRLVTYEQVVNALRVFSGKNRPFPKNALGSILVEQGALTEGQRLDLIGDQNRRNQDSLIPGYRIDWPVAHGSMGSVYRARHEESGEVVALKILADHVLCRPDSISRFLREARTACRLGHPNLVQGYRVGEVDGLYYYAMELVEGRNLAQVLREGPLSEEESLSIVRQVASALDHAHRHGFVHRDVKPANILLTPDGQAKLADLGLVKRIQRGDAFSTQVGAIVGTPSYMSPEQARGEDVDIRSDLYSLGISFFHMVTGHPPFRNAAPVVIMSSHIQVDLPRIRHSRPDLSVGVRRVIRGLCQKDPGLRPQDPATLLRDLDALERPGTIGVDSKPPRPSSATPSLLGGTGHVLQDSEVDFARRVLESGAMEKDRLLKCLDLQNLESLGGNVRSLQRVLEEEGGLDPESSETILRRTCWGRRNQTEERFGTLAVRLGYVTEDQVERALQIQDQAPPGEVRYSLGEVLVSLRMIRLSGKIEILAHQYRRERLQEDRRFGKIAVDAGLVTRTELRNAIELQKTGDSHLRERPLGEILCRNGTMTGREARAILWIQKRQACTGESIPVLICKWNQSEADVRNTRVSESPADQSVRSCTVYARAGHAH